MFLHMLPFDENLGRNIKGSLRATVLLCSCMVFIFATHDGAGAL